MGFQPEGTNSGLGPHSMGCWSPDRTKRMYKRENVHIKVAILYVLNLDGVISNIDRVNLGVLEHLAAPGVNLEVPLPVNDAA